MGDISESIKDLKKMNKETIESILKIQEKLHIKKYPKMTFNPIYKRLVDTAMKNRINYPFPFSTKEKLEYLKRLLNPTIKFELGNLKFLLGKKYSYICVSHEEEGLINFNDPETYNELYLISKEKNLKL